MIQRCLEAGGSIRRHLPRPPPAVRELSAATRSEGFPYHKRISEWVGKCGLTERVKLEVKAEAFNVFNHPNFGAPINVLSNPLFGISQQSFGRDFPAEGLALTRCTRSAVRVRCSWQRSSGVEKTRLKSRTRTSGRLRPAGVVAGVLIVLSSAQPHVLRLSRQLVPRARPAEMSSSQEPSTRTIEFDTDEGARMSLDVSPDGKTIVFDLLGYLYVLPITGGTSKRISTGDGFYSQPRYGPHGRLCMSRGAEHPAELRCLLCYSQRECSTLASDVGPG